MRPLPAAEAYRLWAPSYGPETVVSALDERLVHRLTPPLAGRRLLDAGCGTGRRLASASAAASLAAGIDLVPDMLVRSLEMQLPGSASSHTLPAAAAAAVAPSLPAGDVPSARYPHRLTLAAADVCAMPFRDQLFDVVWCRLVLGHLPFLPGAYAELARVCRPGGTVIVTDFHPAAAAAGHRRTFHNADGLVCEVAHHVHTGQQHGAAAAAAGLRLGLELEEGVGPAVLPFYALAAKTDRYLADLGLPLVLGLRFQKS